MPAEWERHARTITVWPDPSSLPEHDVLASARLEISAIANAIAQFEPVTMYTRPEHVGLAQNTVSREVTVVGLEACHLWVRDTGPIFVKKIDNGETTALGLNFNYWGGKLPRDGDENVAENIVSETHHSHVVAPFQGEGGAIEVDGEGTLLATESSIINTNRNPGISKQQLEEYFNLVLGVTKTIWLPGLKGYDLTDYHIDAFARFLAPGTVLLGKPPANAHDLVLKAYREANDVLSRETDSRGRRLHVVEVMEPDLTKVPGEHFGFTIASYVNYLVVNEGLIVPRFNVGEADEEALDVFRGHFPDRKIVQVDINALPKMGGGIHCATQQVVA
ncbi:hypothetical protein AK830_g4640 [Neonectria ditissima]|uniref:Agmatine deiminase n=1 Tax=Neonectria ditissima TaxID=78410 RepID=A0A0N8H7I8_9HYPO|nr:hypothetical protein AK830_g4640 [Neonectria ditissima]